MKDMADLKLWKMSRVKKEANNACSVFYILLYSLMNNLHHNTVLSIYVRSVTKNTYDYQ